MAGYHELRMVAPTLTLPRKTGEGKPIDSLGLLEQPAGDG